MLEFNGYGSGNYSKQTQTIRQIHMSRALGVGVPFLNALGVTRLYDSLDVPVNVRDDHTML